MGNTTFSINGNVLSMERVFSGSVDEVWDAWSDPDVFASWWGPRGWETTVKKHNFETGGELLYGMKCVDESQGEWYGQESWGKMVFDEVNPKMDFTYTDYFCSSEGEIDDSMPASKAVNSLLEDGEKTRFRSVVTYETEAALQQVMAMGMEAGIDQTFDRLEDLLHQSA